LISLTPAPVDTGAAA